MVANMSTSHRPPAGLFGKLLMPAPAAVKGSACGPLRALDRFGRGHRLPIMTGGARPFRKTLPLLFSLASDTWNHAKQSPGDA